MKAPLRYRLLFLALVLLIGVSLLKPSLLFNYAIDPLTRIAWLVIRTFLVIDQKVYWVLLIFAVFMFVLRIIPTRPEPPLRPLYSDRTKLDDRVAYWEGLLQSAEERADARSTLQQELASLNQVIQELAEGADQHAVDLPPIPKSTQNHAFGKWSAALQRRFLLKPGKQEDTDLEKQVESILKRLETKLERNND
jgi:signal transduction histidine kinase